MYSCVKSGSIHGVDGSIIYVEADVSNGLPAFSLVGLLSSEVREAGERVRSALKNSGFRMQPKRITVNLSPADVKKSGAGYDLAIALAILCAYEYIPMEACEDCLFLGELGLDGMLKPVKGVLSIVDEARRQGISRCIVPYENLAEARLIEGLTIFGAKSLMEVISYFLAGEPLYTESEIVEVLEEDSVLDFADIRGQMALKRAVTIAASGMHNILIGGPPGSGKSMIAKRIPTILPQLTYRESMALTKIYSVSGLLVHPGALMQNRPFRAPHHTISSKALIGGGMTPRPGEISLAHCGVLFLDEFPEFPKTVIEGLRQPLEDRKATVARVNATYTFPADFMLVAAMNMCPCGHFPDLSRCTCTEYARRRYMARISQPILDRMDVQILIQPVRYEELYQKQQEIQDSAYIRGLVARTHEIQHERYQNESILFNSQLEGRLLDQYCELDRECRSVLQQAYDRLGLSARAGKRVIRVARTIADMEEESCIAAEHLLEALSYREMEGLSR